MSSWFIIMAHTGCEAEAAESLRRMNVNAQCPVVVERRVRPRKHGPVLDENEKAMFEGYFFVQADYVPDWFRKERHIIKPLWSWESPTRISEGLVKAALECSGKITVNEWRTAQRFYSGQYVRHNGSSLVGKIDEVRGRKLILLVELLGKIHRKTVMMDQVAAE